MTPSGKPGPGQSQALALERDAGEVVAGSVLGSVAADALPATGGRVDDAVSAFGLLQRRVTLSIRRSSGARRARLVFLPMWVTMMVAMMFPTIAPIVLAHWSVVSPPAAS